MSDNEQQSADIELAVWKPSETGQGSATADCADASTTAPDPAPKELGGPRGLEPTRYGDWERKGRCIDF